MLKLSNLIMEYGISAHTEGVNESNPHVPQADKLRQRAYTTQLIVRIKTTLSALAGQDE
jgi:hypothetical protein